MRRTVLIVDGSETMSASGEYLPNKLLAMRTHLASFVEQYFQQSPLSLLSTIVLRDGVAHRLTPFTNDVHEVLKVLELRLFLQKPSGALSIENGLRVALAELAKDHIAPSGGAEADPASALAPLNSRIVLLLGSVTVVDPGDVLHLVRIVEKAKIMCDVLSLVGSPNVAAQLAHCGGGTLFCPVSHAHLESIVAELAGRTPMQQAKNRGGAKPAPVEVGFPTEAVTAASAEGKPSCVCPRCHSTLTNVPETCRTCGLLVCSVPHIHTAFLLSNNMVAGNQELDTETADEIVANAKTSPACSMCGAVVTGGAKAVMASLVECSGCHEVRCRACEAYVAGTLRLCPTCVGKA